MEPQAATAQTGSKAATHDIEAVKELLDLQANPTSLSLPKDGQAEVTLRNLNARDKRVVGIVRPSFGALTPEGVAKLDYIAGAHDRSRNSEINQAIRQYIAAYEKENGKITKEDLEALEGTGE